jgi:hypothetical protein
LFLKLLPAQRGSSLGWNLLGRGHLTGRQPFPQSIFVPARPDWRLALQAFSPTLPPHAFKTILEGTRSINSPYSCLKKQKIDLSFINYWIIEYL